METFLLFVQALGRPSKLLDIDSLWRICNLLLSDDFANCSSNHCLLPGKRNFWLILPGTGHQVLFWATGVRVSGTELRLDLGSEFWGEIKTCSLKQCHHGNHTLKTIWLLNNSRTKFIWRKKNRLFLLHQVRERMIALCASEFITGDIHWKNNAFGSGEVCLRWKHPEGEITWNLSTLMLLKMNLDKRVHPLV